MIIEYKSRVRALKDRKNKYPDAKVTRAKVLDTDKKGRLYWRTVYRIHTKEDTA